jgi:hypothetical protein|tara:strand:- start:2714 stop:3862 length:1149 start_codon:yes stop_codon:yes gene_type:complete
MKITVLGKGNAGCVSALHFHYWGQFLEEPIEVEVIHDSKISPVPVGQASNLTLPVLLWQALGSDVASKFSFTRKDGIMYENWGTKNKFIMHHFPMGNYGIHFNPSELQKYILDSLKINFIEKDENVVKYNDIDSDYIIDCRGTPKSFKNYDKLINPLNHVVLGSLPVKKNDVTWTRTIATKDGWCFYIPLKDRISLGYNFNDKITPVKTAENNFKNLFKIDKTNAHFPYKQYIAKKPVIDNRVILNGNRFFFLEPLEATAVATYQKWCQCIWDAMINKTCSFDDSVINIRTYIDKVQNFILYHYMHGSTYKTSFWKYATKLAKDNQDPKIKKIIRDMENQKQPYLRSITHRGIDYAQWETWNLKLWQEGVTKKNDISNFNYR